MSQYSIVDTMQAITQSKEINFDYASLDKEKALALMGIQSFQIDERCADISTLVLCSYEGKTYLIDENTRLWDIDTDGELSMLSVGVVGHGVDGFVVDVLKTAVENDDISTVEALQYDVEAWYLEALQSRQTA